MESDSNLEIRIKTDPDAGTLTIMYAPNFILFVCPDLLLI